MTSVCIHQPDFMPFLGFYQKLQVSDIYIVLDTVQFVKRGWHNRDYIKTPQGSALMTVPVKNKGRYRQRLSDTEICMQSEWKEKHLKMLQHNYQKAPYYDRFMPDICRLYEDFQPMLVDFNVAIIRYFLEQFSISLKMMKASELKCSGRKNELLLSLCSCVCAQRYVTGRGSLDYIDFSYFAREGIEVDIVEFQPRPYHQLFGKFIPFLSAIDFLFNKGPAVSQYITFNKVQT